MADIGQDVIVISPVPKGTGKEGKDVLYSYVEKTNGERSVRVFRPRFPYAGNQCIGPVHTGRFSVWSMTRACQMVLEREGLCPDVFYGHFVCPAGMTACRLGKTYGRPAYIAFGESTDAPLYAYGLKKVRAETASCSGFVAVSGQNKNRLMELGLSDDERCGIFPNGTDPSIFHPLEKKSSRELFGLPEGRFIVSFVGQFTDRKGILRLEKAVETVKDVYLICAGTGPLRPKSDKVLYCGQLPSEQIPVFLSASDLFVLPTRNEGCPNAVIEAMSCGLPVITSDRPFVYDIIDKKSALLVDPDNIQEIADAILRMKRDEAFRSACAERSVQRAALLTIQNRARQICAWINERNNQMQSS